MPDLSRREALKLATVIGVDAMGSPIARAADDPRAIRKRSRIAYEQAVLADRPVAYWRLGEASGPTAVDATGHGHNGKYHGHVTYGETGAIEGDRNTAVGLRAHEYVEIPDSVHFSQPESHAGLTVEVWMRPDALDFPGQAAHLQDDPYVHWLGKGVAGQYEWGFRFYSLHKDPQDTISSRHGPTGSRRTFGIRRVARAQGAYFPGQARERAMAPYRCLLPAAATRRIPRRGSRFTRMVNFAWGRLRLGRSTATRSSTSCLPTGPRPCASGRAISAASSAAGLTRSRSTLTSCPPIKVQEHYKIAMGD